MSHCGFSPTRAPCQHLLLLSHQFIFQQDKLFKFFLITFCIKCSRPSSILKTNQVHPPHNLCKEIPHPSTPRNQTVQIIAVPERNLAQGLQLPMSWVLLLGRLCPQDAANQNAEGGGEEVGAAGTGCAPAGSLAFQDNAAGLLPKLLGGPGAGLAWGLSCPDHQLLVTKREKTSSAQLRLKNFIPGILLEVPNLGRRAGQSPGVAAGSCPAVPQPSARLQDRLQCQVWSQPCWTLLKELLSLTCGSGGGTGQICQSLVTTTLVPGPSLAASLCQRPSVSCPRGRAACFPFQSTSSTTEVFCSLTQVPSGS